MPAYFPESELIWAAGFFDGEGSTSVSMVKGYLTLSVSIGQVGDYCLLRFRDAVEEGTIYGPNHSDKYQYMARNEKGVEVIKKLYPYLCPPKQVQARTALMRYNESLVVRLPYAGKSRSCWVPEEV